MNLSWAAIRGGPGWRSSTDWAAEASCARRTAPLNWPGTWPRGRRSPKIGMSCGMPTTSRGPEPALRRRPGHDVHQNIQKSNLYYFRRYSLGKWRARGYVGNLQSLVFAIFRKTNIKACKYTTDKPCAGWRTGILGGAPGSAAGLIKGSVFLDENGDGRRNAGEQVVANIAVTLDDRFTRRPMPRGNSLFSAGGCRKPCNRSIAG